MTAVTALGIDPGPVPGLVLAAWEPGKHKAARVQAFQCNAAAAPALLGMILAARSDSGEIFCGQIEEFRTLRGAGTRGIAASLTREMVTVLAGLAEGRGVRLAIRHSSQVFPWASDKRLAAAGLLKATAQLPHARAASRHALWTAVADGGLPDPLSKMVMT